MRVARRLVEAWPYRPREGKPPIPRWLLVIFVFGAIALWVVIAQIFGTPGGE
jgi:hypothetical protein